MTNLQELARQMSDAFETRTRDNGENFDVLRDGSPEWMKDACMDAHGSMFPDDWRYRMIRAAVDWLADDGDDPEGAGEFADDFVPVYTRERLDWLASHLDRPSYVDEAAEIYGAPDDRADIVTQTGMGIYMEAFEVYSLLVTALEAIAEEDEDEDEEAA